MGKKVVGKKVSENSSGKKVEKKSLTKSCGEKLRKNLGKILEQKFENKVGGKHQVEKLKGKVMGKSGGKR